jgi:hypothetical protein
VTQGELEDRLSRVPILAIGADEWAESEAALEVAARHATQLSGEIVVVRGDSGWIVVEEPEPETRLLRLLPDEGSVQRFVARRLEAYERMWDGCGCKIDYYA